MSDIVAAEAWGKRTVILAAFGLVGAGALLGAGSVYFMYLKHRIEEHFALQSTITSEIHQLKEDVKLIRSSIHDTPSDVKKPVKPKSALKDVNARKSVKFANGYETAEDDEYITASSDSDAEKVNSVLSKTSRVKGNVELVVSVSAIDNPELAFYDQIDALLDGDSVSQHEAFSQLKVNQERLKGSCGYWWRLAKATHLEAQAAGNNGDNELRKNLAFSAFNSAEKGLKLNERSSDAHKWYAITIGSKGDFLSTNDRIKNGFVFKEHIDKAVKLNANDSTLYHLLGRFCYEVSQLSWMERKLAATLFSAPPTATVSEASAHFQTAEKKGKPFKENRLYLAKCCISASDNAGAARWLSMASNLPVLTASDKAAQEEINKLLPKYKKYLS